MEQNRKSTTPWNFTKGMVLSYSALAVTLINSGTITPDALIEELDRFIDMISIKNLDSPDSIEIIETIEMTKDSISNLYAKDESSKDPSFTWISDFIGNS